MMFDVSVARARELVHLQRWSDAAAALAPVLADPGADAEAWCLLAQCQLGVGNPWAAREAARRALGVDPDEEWAFRLLAMTELRYGNGEPARQAAERALALAPGTPSGLYVLTQAHLLRRRRGDRGRAAEVARQAIALNPNVALTWQTAADVALARRRWREAEEHARRGLAIDPQDADLLLHLATALEGQRRFTEAGELYAATVRADPRDDRGRRALSNLGVPLAGAGVGIAMVGGIQAVIHQDELSEAATTFVRSAGTAATALVAAAALGLAYGTVVGFHHWATRGLRPDVRAVARRERHRHDHAWQLTAAAVAFVVALLGLVTAEYVTSAVLLGVVVALLVPLRSRFRVVRPELPELPPGTLRRIWDDVVAIPREILQSMRLRRR
jgi:tetratricopeptide (TPR) repeat protein